MKYHQPFDQPGNPDASYVNANTSLGVKGSILDGVAVEQAQREILKVVTEAGLTPSDTDLTQLWQAIQSIAGTITNTAITNYLTGGAVDVNIPYAVAGGTADAITGTFSPVLTALTDGQVVILKVGAASNATTSPTLNANSLGAKAIVRNDGSALAVNDLVATGFAILIYDTGLTSWKFVAGLALAGGGGGGSFVPGVPYPWLTETPPVGTLECNGAAVSRATYSRLFGILNTRYGAGDGSTTFNLPDFRDEFLRGWDHARGADPDRGARTDRGDGTTGDHVGTKQGSAAGAISLTGGAIEIDSLLIKQGVIWTGVDVVNNGPADGSPSQYLAPKPGSDVVGTIPSLKGSTTISGYSGATETRSRNVNVMYVIAY